MTTPTAQRGLLSWGQMGRYAAYSDRQVITALAGNRHGIVIPANLAPGPGPLQITVQAGWLGVAIAGDGTMCVVSGRIAYVLDVPGGGGSAQTLAVRAVITDPETATYELAVTAPQPPGLGGLTLGEVVIPPGATNANQMTLTRREQDFADGAMTPGPAGPTGATGSQGPEGPPGPQGTGLTFREPVAQVSNLPPSGNNPGDLRIVTATGDAWAWDADASPPAWFNVGPIRGPTGLTGPAGPPGADSTVPGPPGVAGEQGDPGPPGEAVGQYPAETNLEDNQAWLNQGVTTWTRMCRYWPVPANTIDQGTRLVFRAMGTGRIGNTTQAQGFRWNFDPVGFPNGPGTGRADIGGVLFDTDRDFSWQCDAEIWFASGGPAARWRGTCTVWAAVTTGNMLPATGAQGSMAGLRVTGNGTMDTTVEQRFWLEHMWHANAGSPYIRAYGSALEVKAPSLITRLGGVADPPQQHFDVPPPPPSQPQERNFTSTYRPFMTASYAANGNRRNVNGDMFQGTASGNPGGWGDQFAIAMYDYNRIRADLTGHGGVPARVQWVNLTIRANHTWFNSGGELRIGWANRTDLPGSGVWQPVNAGGLGVHNFGKPQQRTLSVNTLNSIVGNTGFTAICVGQAGSSTNLNRYVVCDGGTGNLAPFLTVNYSKLVL